MTAQIVIILLLLMVNGLFAMTEIALVSSRKSRLRSLAERGDSRAKIALELAESPTRFLSTVQVGITLVGILAGAFGGATVAHRLEEWVARIGFLEPYSEALSLGIVVVMITFCSLVIGELVPKRLALNAPETISLAMAKPMNWLASTAFPIVRILTAVTDGIIALFRIRSGKGSAVTEEDVKTLVREGLLAGVIHQTESEMVERVLDLDRYQVSNLMTPRPNIVWLDVNAPPEEVWRKIVASFHTNFPVYEGNRDHVLGLVSVKALWANLAAGVPAALRDLAVPAHMIPETLSVIRLLELFKQTGKHIALVVDEFGSITGLVTSNDVFEAIAGDLPEEGESRCAQIQQREDGSWLVDASISVKDFKTGFGFDALPGEQETGFKSLAGFVVSQLGRIPVEGEAFSWNDYRFEVIDMDRQRVDKVLVSGGTDPGSETTA